MNDPTEAIRREMIAANAPEIDLIDNEGPTWDTEALRRDFDVLGFQAPFVVARRRSDGVLGSLEFTHARVPRIYFNWKAD